MSSSRRGAMLGSRAGILVQLLCLLMVLFPQATLAATPPDDTTEFVKQVYRDFLNREPDAEGLTFWVDQLEAGTYDRSELVEQSLLTEEFGQTIAPIIRLYFTSYQRIPDFDGLMFWVYSYKNGVSLDDISETFAAAQEFIDTYGTLTNEEFVSQIYINVYGREPDSGGLAYWAGQLDSAALTRGQVLVEFSSAEEYLNLSANQVYLTMTYMGLLRRAPEQDGFDYWVGIMDGGASGLGLIDSFLLSDEYAARFAEPFAVTLNDQLLRPWGMAFLPDDRILVTEKAGRLVILSADGTSIQAEVGGMTAVEDVGQGGLLDVAIDPDFAVNAYVYWTYSESGTGVEVGLSGTAVARGRLVGNALQDIEVIYRQIPKVSGSGHFGSRLVFGNDKTLFVTLGERQKGSPAQDLATTLGKVIRINRDGTVPADNPMTDLDRAEIWSYGHRNPQGAAIRPWTDQLWITEHGPQGGDELNLIIPGGNYGWPVVSYGCNYGDPVGDACRIGGGTHAPEYFEPISYWVPTSIAPSGILFYTGNRFAAWQGNIFIGALAGKSLWRIRLDGDQEIERQAIFSELAERIRDVEQGPDGWIYLLTDSGKLIQIRN